ncbi:MAG TPA: indolepyruvate oxidoreductase subunit beta [Bacteroidales bacterium]|nr:indolepyruvate oxidoreductase subunit beta [Bacteroidales bacterium]HPS74220.1 indolepyruvate oxidoreductase subunit beta [Bacteroidales bacterium]
MKKDIILAGVGGQGILSIAAVIGYAALDQGMYLKQSEVHGMSQRGGDVSSNLRISKEEIASDLIPYGKADLIISVEPMESLRYLPYLSESGWVITSTTPFINVPNYPEIEKVHQAVASLPKHVALDAETIAKEAGSAKSANMVILGAASPFLGMSFESIKKAVRATFEKKGEDIVNMNLNALQAGHDIANKKIG